MLVLCRITFPSSFTVANVSSPSKTNSAVEPAGRLGFWKMFRYVHDFSFTHLVFSSLKPIKGSSILRSVSMSMAKMVYCERTSCWPVSPGEPQMEPQGLASKHLVHRCL